MLRSIQVLMLMAAAGLGLGVSGAAAGESKGGDISGLERQATEAATLVDSGSRLAQGRELAASLAALQPDVHLEAERQRLARLAIRVSILKGDFAEAGRGIGGLLETLPAGGEPCVLALSDILTLVDELAKDGGSDLAVPWVEQALKAVATRPDDSSLRCEVMERALLQGQYDVVLASEKIQTAGKPAFDGHRADLLRARAASAVFYHQYCTTPDNGVSQTDENKATFARLASDCTRLHERALAGASGELERARIASQWWSSRILPHFLADSKALRNTFPFTPVAKVPEDAEKQVEAFRSAVSEGLQHRQSAAPMADDVRQAFVKALGDEFQRFAVMSIPNEEMKEVLKGLPDFCDTALPIMQVKSPEEAALTMRWYLWRAIILDLPDRVEREAIDAQIERIVSFLEQQADEFSKAAGTAPAGKDFAKRFLAAYQRFKDNRFVPYYKRAWAPDQEEAMWAYIREKAPRIAQSLTADVARLRAGGTDTPAAKYKEAEDDALEWLRVEVYRALTASSIPNSLHMPGHHVFKSGGTLNQYNIYLFQVFEVEPFPAFEHFDP